MRKVDADYVLEAIKGRYCEECTHNDGSVCNTCLVNDFLALVDTIADEKNGGHSDA